MEKTYRMNTYLLIGLALIVAMVLIIVMRNLFGHWQGYRRHSRNVRNEKERLAFLIDKDFVVKETNYYDMNPLMKDDQPRVLGNVLHCKTGCDSGLCGTGISCQTCPVRFVLKNSFLQRRNVKSVEATMMLYDQNHKPREIDVRIDGDLVSVNNELYMIVKVENTSQESE